MLLRASDFDFKAAVGGKTHLQRIPKETRTRAVTFKAGDVPVVVAHIDDMIALKQALGRPIDPADIAHLKR